MTNDSALIADRQRLMPSAKCLSPYLTPHPAGLLLVPYPGVTYLGGAHGARKPRADLSSPLPGLVIDISGGGGLCGGWSLGSSEAAQIDYRQKDRVLEDDPLIVLFSFGSILRFTVCDRDLPVDVRQELLDETK